MPTPETPLEAVLAEQRRDWIAGTHIAADERMRLHPELAGEPACAAELIYHEFSLRQELGESPDWQQQLRQYPEHAVLLERLRHADQLVEQALAAPVPERWSAGTFGDYVLLEEVGRGGMGIVFKARHKSLDRIVALKVLRSDGTGEERKRFDREAQAVARLQHPNIVQVYEVGENTGGAFVSLEFVDGQSLARRLHGTPLPARQAAALVDSLARAMHYAHEKGVIHRDLKPANVLLAGTPETRLEACVAKVADFGLAKRLDTQGDTQSGAVLGTPSYMAPEQAEARSAAIDRRTDVYGLGAILYELLTGRPPFRADTPLQTLKQVVEAEPARPRLLNSAVPRDLETVCLKCLGKEPQGRYPSAAALAGDLERWLLGFPIEARPVSKLEHASRWCRRRPAVASLLAVLALTVASSLVGLLTLWRHSETERARAENALARSIESDKATSGAVRDLVGLLASTAQSPQMLAYERLFESSRAVRDLTAKLRQDRADAASIVVAICGLERELAAGFWSRGNYAESGRLLTDAVELLEAQRRSNDPDVAEAYARALMQLGWNARDEGRHDEMLPWLERAEGVLQVLAEELQNVEVIVSIDEVRTAIAVLFDRRGQDESRRRLLEAHIRMLERLSARAGGDPAIGLMAALARVSMAPDKSASAEIRAAMERCPANRRLPERLAKRLAVWIARDIQPYPADPKSTGKPQGRRDPEVSDLLICVESRFGSVSVIRERDEVWGDPRPSGQQWGWEVEMVPSVIVEITWHVPGGRYHSPSIITADPGRGHAHQRLNQCRAREWPMDLPLRRPAAVPACRKRPPLVSDVHRPTDLPRYMPLSRDRAGLRRLEEQRHPERQHISGRRDERVLLAADRARRFGADTGSYDPSTTIAGSGLEPKRSRRPPRTEAGHSPQGHPPGSTNQAHSVPVRQADIRKSTDSHAAAAKSHR
jgi:serine/threonine protein kinase